MKLFSRVSMAALAVLAVSTLTFAGAGGVAQGKVKAVSDKTVTLTDDSGSEMTFEVSQGARVYAEGASHRSQMLASSGKKTTMDAFVREGQYVTVHFREGSGTRQVTQLRVHGRAAQS
jgi:hypothetical protein